MVYSFYFSSLITCIIYRAEIIHRMPKTAAQKPTQFASLCGNLNRECRYNIFFFPPSTLKNNITVKSHPHVFGSCRIWSSSNQMLYAFHTPLSKRNLFFSTNLHGFIRKRNVPNLLSSTICSLEISFSFKIF